MRKRKNGRPSSSRQCNRSTSEFKISWSPVLVRSASACSSKNENQALDFRTQASICFVWTPEFLVQNALLGWLCGAVVC